MGVAKLTTLIAAKSRAPVGGFHFQEWLDKVRLEDKTKTYYRDEWRLLKTTTVNMRLDQITRDVIETLRFSGASSNANCALRTLRRMLHKAEEWTLIRHA
jgi:hypothetical protein